jgi:hypothetical protein
MAIGVILSFACARTGAADAQAAAKTAARNAPRRTGTGIERITMGVNSS